MDNNLIPFYEVFLIFSQPAAYFEKSLSQIKIYEDHLFLTNSSWGALLLGLDHTVKAPFPSLHRFTRLVCIVVNFQIYRVFFPFIFVKKQSIF